MKLSENRAKQHIVALLVLALVSLPVAAAAQSPERFPLIDQKEEKIEDSLARLDRVMAFDFSTVNQDAVMKLRQSLDELDAVPSDGDLAAATWVGAWDALANIDMTFALAQQIAPTLSPDVADTFLNSLTHINNLPNRQLVTLPMGASQLLSVMMLRDAAGYLESHPPPLTLTDSVLLSASPDCPIRSGGVKIVSHHHVLFGSRNGHFMFIAVPGSTQLFLLPAEVRYATIATEDGLEIDAPDQPAMLIKLTKVDNRFETAEVSSGSCSLTLEPA